MKTYNLLYGLLIVAVLSSCSGMNDLHDKYLKNGEINYTGRVDSAQVFGGANRLMLRYYLSDPKAKNLWVYWNLKTDSTLFVVPEKNAKEPVEVYINDLEEGDIFLDLFTFNGDMEDKSVPFQVDGTVYGSKYQQTLRNRAVKSTDYDESQNVLRIEWGDAGDGEAHTKVYYTDIDDIDRTITVGIDESVTTIPDFECLPVYYSTTYKPHMSIDDFTAPQSLLSYNGNITSLLTNAGRPASPRFDYDAESGYVLLSTGLSSNRWYYVTGWKTNEQGRINGNVDSHTLFQYRLCMSANGSPAQYPIVNGKLYQTVENLAPGTYRFAVTIYHKTTLDIIMVASKGDDLPDINNPANETIPDMSQVLGFASVPRNTQISQTDTPFYVDFVLAETSDVSLGVVANVTSAQLIFSKVELWRMF